MEKLFDLLMGCIYSAIFVTGFMSFDGITNWRQYNGIVLAIGISYAIHKWNKTEIDNLKEEIKQLKEK